MNNRMLTALFVIPLALSGAAMAGAQTVDIKCHNSDNHVEVFWWEPVFLEIDVQPGSLPVPPDVDVWVLIGDMENEETRYYDGVKPLEMGFSGWKLVGPGQAPYFSGKLSTGKSEMVFDMMLPVGGYAAHVFMDSTADKQFGGGWVLSDAVTFYVMGGTHPEFPGMEYIPAGEFTLGDAHCGCPYCFPANPHKVALDAFLMDRAEVTNEEYCAFLNGAGSDISVNISAGLVHSAVSTKKEALCAVKISPASGTTTAEFEWNATSGMFTVKTGRKYHPVTQVTWYGAAVYCNWKSAQKGRAPCYDPNSDWACDFTKNGVRLPTEAEWEYAARGGFPPSSSCGTAAAPRLCKYPQQKNSINVSDAHISGTSAKPVESYNNTGYNLFDMAGNVSEWCNDWYGAGYYGGCPGSGTVTNPTGPSMPASHPRRVKRGGSFRDALKLLRTAIRSSLYPAYSFDDLGFRTVKNIPCPGCN